MLLLSVYCRMPAAQVVHGASDEVLISGGHDQCVKIWDCRSRSIDPIQIMRHFKVGTCDRYFVVVGLCCGRACSVSSLLAASSLRYTDVSLAPSAG
jgi:hypothetical protein